MLKSSPSVNVFPFILLKSILLTKLTGFNFQPLYYIFSDILRLNWTSIKCWDPILWQQQSLSVTRHRAIVQWRHHIRRATSTDDAALCCMDISCCAAAVGRCIGSGNWRRLGGTRCSNWRRALGRLWRWSTTVIDQLFTIINYLYNSY